MMKILVTGAKGFIGKNLIAWLRNRNYQNIFEFDIDTKEELLDEYCREADFVFNLAGINRPKRVEEFMEGNRDFVATLLHSLRKHGNNCPILLSSSVQAELNNPYGASKRAGEELYLNHGRETGAKVFVYRLPNVFGKWCRPNYNSAVATFCNNIARDLPITVNDPEVILKLVYIDDVIEEFVKVLEETVKVKENAPPASEDHDNTWIKEDAPPRSEDHDNIWIKEDVPPRSEVHDNIWIIENAPLRSKDENNFYGEGKCGEDKIHSIPTVYQVRLGYVADLLYSFQACRENLEVPELSDDFTKKLYSTYLSYLPTDQFAYPLKMNEDERGSFTEFIRTKDRGQVSVNISKPGIVKGNHWHHTKNEKFLVVAGKGVIRFRAINGYDIIQYFVDGEKLQVVDIPPGYTHNIENLGESELVTVMWVNEPFDKERPDTYFLEV